MRWSIVGSRPVISFPIVWRCGSFVAPSAGLWVQVGYQGLLRFGAGEGTAGSLARTGLSCQGKAKIPSSNSICSEIDMSLSKPFNRRVCNDIVELAQ